MDLTEHEKYWWDIKLNCDKEAKELDNNSETDWHIRDTTVGLSKYLEYAIKYENLRDPEQSVTVRNSLIKINKALPLKILDFDGYNYILFNGIYIVHEVALIEQSLCDKFFNHKDKVFYSNSDLGIPDNTIMGTFKDVYFEDTGRHYGACLIASPFTERYGIDYCSSWNYVYF